MVDLVMVRESRKFMRLVPATQMDEDRLRGLRTDDPFQVQITFTRTSRLNRWYRGLVGHVAEGIGADPNALHADLKFKAGLVQQILALPASGERPPVMAVQLRSTAFPLMDDVEFSTYCDVATELLFRDYLPHIKGRQQAAHITAWAGRRPRLEAA